MTLPNDIRRCTACALATLRGTDCPPGAPAVAVPAEVGTRYHEGGLCFLAESPGVQETVTGRPLVGRAGKVFDQLLADAGVGREDLLIMNRVRCHPPRNRLGDHPYALTACDPWTRAELKVYNPGVVIVAGKTALSMVFPGNPRVGDIHGVARATGEEFDYGARVWLATYHPAAIARRYSQELYDKVLADVEEGVRQWQRLSYQART